MIISHARKFIYLKTIKTGSSSVEAYFEPFCVTKELYDPTLIHDHSFTDRGIVISRYSTKLTKKKGWHTHMPAPMLREMLSEMDKRCAKAWDKYFKFTVIRNPYDRAVSWFYYNERHREFDEDITLEDLQEKFEKYTISSFMSDWNIYTIDNVPSMDYYIRYEDMENGMSDVCNKLKIAWKPKKMPKHLSGLRDNTIDPKLLFTDVSRLHIEKLCYHELEYFKYEFPF